jgi:phage FluMu gp28-like protein
MAIMFAMAMGIAWIAEHRQLRAAVLRESEAKDKSAAAEYRCIELRRQIEYIDHQLIEHGMRIGWICAHPKGIVSVVEKADSHDPN